MAREPFNRVWAENPDGTGPNTFQEPSNTRLEKGWVGGASGEPPLAGEENWWHNRVDAAMQQIERYGVMDWHAKAIYGIGGRARGSDGKFYLSLSTPNEANDPTADDGTNWVKDVGPGQNIAVFDAAGVTNWDVPEVLKAGLRKARVTVVGGGGGGGGGGASGGSSSAASAGGGAGAGTSEGIIDLSGASTVAITVGDGGIGGSAGNNPGANGGTSSFGTFLSAAGGNGGQGMSSTSSNSKVVGGTGGVGTGGDVNLSGSDGGGGSVVSGGAALPTGHGGASSLSGMTRQPNDTNPGRNALGYGGGGSGATVNPTGGNQAGGNGTPGVVIVRW